MELVLNPSVAASFTVDAKHESIDAWIQVTERLPAHGQRVRVQLESSQEVRIAWLGRYQSTGAWFDARTRGPIYEKIVRWQPK